MIAIGAGTAVVAAALALAVFAASQPGGAAPHRAGPLAAAKTSAGITPAADPSTSPATTPTPTPTPSGPVLGAQLGTYPNIQLSDGYSINLSPDPQHPSQDGDPGNRQGDLQFVGGKLQAAQLAMVAPGTAGGYVACRDNTAYAPALPVSDGTPGNPGLAPGAQVCVTTSSGLIGLLTVAAVQSNPVKFVSFSLTTWQGQPAAQPSADHPASLTGCGQALRRVAPSWRRGRAGPPRRACVEPPRRAWPATRALRACGCGAAAGWVTTTGTPEGVRAPVMRTSSASPGRTFTVSGAIPAVTIIRDISRRWLGVTRVTTVPDSPALAVRPPRCR
jgi:hypothetical protein